MLGTRIASLRQGFGLSQAELAKRLNISPSAIGMYEQGRRQPSVDTLIALSREFGVSLDYLVAGQMTTVRDVTALHRLMEDTVKKNNTAQDGDSPGKEELICHLLWALLA